LGVESMTALVPSWAAGTRVCDRNSFAAAADGRCPVSDWKDALAPLLALPPNPGEPLHFVNAGANKGFAIADFLNRFHAKHGLSVRDWYQNLTSIKRNTYLACGFCNDCQLGPPLSQHHVAVKVHAFELLHGNYVMLARLFERLKVPGMVHATALSNFTGNVWRPRFARTGEENLAAATVGNRWSESTPTTTIDAYATRHGLTSIAWVSLDAEVRAHISPRLSLYHLPVPRSILSPLPAPSPRILPATYSLPRHFPRALLAPVPALCGRVIVGYARDCWSPLCRGLQCASAECSSLRGSCALCVIP